MRIALAQINSVMGDFDGNIQKMLVWTQNAADKHCDLIVFPEMSSLGYSANDLLERPEVIAEQARAIKTFFQKKPKKIDVILGGVAPAEKKETKPLINAAFVSTRPPRAIAKTLLPQYDVFDEGRFFKPGSIRDHLVRIREKKVLILICEDMWAWQRCPNENPLKKIKKSEVDLVISINASPYSLGKEKERRGVATQTASYFKAPVLYVNMVGAQDELIFDGSSFAIDEKGKVLASSAFCAEDLNIIDLKSKLGGVRKAPQGEAEKLHATLVLGIRDFIQKNGFSNIHLGLSGGIDSAVVAALAADAVGPQNVVGLAMPGPYSDNKSMQLARALSKNLGCGFFEYDICRAYETHVSDYEKVFGAQPFGVLHENIQARIRGNILMMYSNSHKSLLLATGNKSEYATGYSTLYGDMCGALAPLGDLLKNQVYALAEYYNRERELIPKEIIVRPPSAELRPNQKDQDSLPPYDKLDAAVEKLVTQQRPAKTDIEKWLLKKIADSEFKRWQAPPILRVTQHAFGRGRRMPITNKFHR